MNGNSKEWGGTKRDRTGCTEWTREQGTKEGTGMETGQGRNGSGQGIIGQSKETEDKESEATMKATREWTQEEVQTQQSGG